MALAARAPGQQRRPHALPQRIVQRVLVERDAAGQGVLDRLGHLGERLRRRDAGLLEQPRHRAPDLRRELAVVVGDQRRARRARGRPGRRRGSRSGSCGRGPAGRRRPPRRTRRASRPRPGRRARAAPRRGRSRTPGSAPRRRDPAPRARRARSARGGRRGSARRARADARIRAPRSGATASFPPVRPMLAQVRGDRRGTPDVRGPPQSDTVPMASFSFLTTLLGPTKRIDPGAHELTLRYTTSADAEALREARPARLRPRPRGHGPRGRRRRRPVGGGVRRPRRRGRGPVPADGRARLASCRSARGSCAGSTPAPCPTSRPSGGPTTCRRGPSGRRPTSDRPLTAGSVACRSEWFPAVLQREVPGIIRREAPCSEGQS